MTRGQLHIFPETCIDSTPQHRTGPNCTVDALWQVICPFAFDQFYWAERMAWMGLAPPPIPHSMLTGELRQAPQLLKASLDEVRGFLGGMLHDMAVNCFFFWL